MKQDFTNSSGNLALPSLNVERPQAKNPIGKEDIRIPIAIGVRRQRFEPKKKMETTVVCPITGIVGKMEGWEIPLEMTFRHPLSDWHNAIKLSFLPLSSIHPSVIAGAILSLGNICSLFEDHLSSVERNLCLSEVYSQTTLVECLVGLRKVIESKADKRILEEKLPKFSFSQVRTGVVSFVEWTKEIVEICFPRDRRKNGEKEKEEQTETLKPVVSIKIKPFVLSIATKRKMKELAASMLLKGIISAKAEGIFRYFATGENWRKLTKDQKSKYILYLTEREGPEIEELLLILSTIPGINSNEDLTFEEEKELKPTEEKKTIQEMLADWRRERGNV